MTSSETGCLTVVLGGIKSGKSAHARQLAEQTAQSMDAEVTFLATARPNGADMQQRIERHRQNRPDTWETLEPGWSLPTLVDRDSNKSRVLLLDEISLWLSDRLQSDEPDTILANLEESLTDILTESLTLIVVSGLYNRTIVPADSQSRTFLRTLGKCNQLLADRAQTVTEITAGIASTIKSPSGDSRNSTSTQLDQA